MHSIAILQGAELALSIKMDEYVRIFEKSFIRQENHKVERGSQNMEVDQISKSPSLLGAVVLITNDFKNFRIS